MKVGDKVLIRNINGATKANYKIDAMGEVVHISQRHWIGVRHEAGYVSSYWPQDITVLDEPEIVETVPPIEFPDWLRGFVGL